MKTSKAGGFKGFKKQPIDWKKFSFMQEYCKFVQNPDPDAK